MNAMLKAKLKKERGALSSERFAVNTQNKELSLCFSFQELDTVQD